MQWLNYHHLLYFWMVAKEGSIAQASKRLRLAQPTISTQIRTLEENLGVELFDRSGRRLVLTDVGRVAYRYADEIFSLGNEMLDVLRDRPPGRPLRFHVGVTCTLDNLLVHRLLAPVLSASEGTNVVCQEDKFESLLTLLARHELDVVLSDAPLSSKLSVRAFNHPLGESTTSVFAPGNIAPKYRRNFPASLDHAPFALPTAGSTLRRELDRWFDDQDLHPQIIGQFDDNATVALFAQSSGALFAGPSVIEKEIKRHYGVHVVGRTDAVRQRYVAISTERRLKHSGVISLVDAAKAGLFA